MATETINIVVRQTGVARVQRDIRNLGKSATSANSALNFMKRTLQGVGAVLVVRQLKSYADSMIQMTNALKVAGFEGDKLAAAQHRLFDISRKTRTSVVGNTQLFRKLSIAQKELGASSEQLFVFTEAVAKAVAIQGTSVHETRGALLQLSQAMGSGTVRAEEFNAILEGAFPIANAAAQGIEKTGGSVARLRSLVIHGKISSKEFFEGLVSQAENLDEVFSRTSPTIGQAFQVLNDSLILYFGELDKSLGLSKAFADFVLKLSLNLDTLAKAVVSIGAGMIVAFGPKVLASIASVGKALIVLVTSNPLGAFLVLLTTAVTALYAFRDNIILVEKANITLGDTLTGIWRSVGTIFEVFVDGIKDTFSSLPDILMEFAVDAVNGVIHTVETGLNALPGVELSLGRVANSDSGAAAAFQKRREARGQKLGKTIGQNIIAARNERQKALEDYDVDFTKDAPKGGLDDNAIAAAKALEKLQKTLRSLKDNLDPLGAAQREVAKSEQTLNKAFAAGLVSANEKDRLLGLLNEKYRDALDPLGAVNRELDKEVALLGMSREARADHQKLLEIEEDLRSKGVQLSESERAALQDRITGLRELNDATERQNSLLKSIAGPQQDYVKNMDALQALLDKGAISMDQFSEKARDMRISLLDAETSASAGLERGMLKLQKEFTDLASVTEEAVTKAFKGMEDALVSFVNTGKLDFQSLADSIIADITRIAVRSSITGPLSNTLNGGGASSLLGGVGNNAGAGGIFGLFDSFFGGAGAGTGGGGGAGGLLGGLFGFASGGSFKVGAGSAVGSLPGQVDNRLVAFRARDGEQVSVTPPGRGGSGGGATVVNMTVVAQDANSFSRSREQILAQMQAGLARANKRNN